MGGDEVEQTRSRRPRPALTVDGLGWSRREGLARLREAIVRRSMEEARDRPTSAPSARDEPPLEVPD